MPLAAPRLAAAALLLAAATSPATLAGAFHGGCSAEGAAEPTFDTGLAAGAAAGLGPGEVHAYVASLGAGEHVVLLASAGDAVLRACRIGGGASCNPQALVAIAACGLGGLPGNPGSGGPLVGPGSFRLEVANCFTAACGAPVDGPSAYLLAWQI